MNAPVNLIPRPRLEARRLSRVIRRWVQGGVIFTLAIGSACAVVQMAWRDAPVDLAAELDAATQRVATTQTDLNQLTDELTATRQRVEANRAVTNQPDWSVLLALLSQSLDESVVLRGCRFESMRLNTGKTRRASETARGRDDGFPVHITGYGDDVQSVSAFVLRLEDAGLFDEVRLISTRSEPLPFNGGRQAIAFEVECFLQIMGGQGHE